MAFEVLADVVVKLSFILILIVRLPADGASQYSIKRDMNDIPDYGSATKVSRSQVPSRCPQPLYWKIPCLPPSLSSPRSILRCAQSGGWRGNLTSSTFV
eukprot:747107-Hanusia_phi.AAC.13